MSGSNRSHHSLSRPLDSLFMVHTALYWKRIGGEMKFNELKRLQSCIQAFQRAYFLMMDSHQRGTSISTPAVPTVEVYTNNNYSISVVLNLVWQDHSKHTHTHTCTHRHPRTQVYYTESTTLTQVKQILQGGLSDGGKTKEQEGKRGGPIVLEKDMFYSWIWKSPVRGFCQRGRGRPLPVVGPKTKKAQEPAVESISLS